MSSAKAVEWEKPIVAKAAAVKRVSVDLVIATHAIFPYEISSIEIMHHFLLCNDNICCIDAAAYFQLTEIEKTETVDVYSSDS